MVRTHPIFASACKDVAQGLNEELSYVSPTSPGLQPEAREVYIHIIQGLTSRQGLQNRTWVLNARKAIETPGARPKLNLVAASCTIMAKTPSSFTLSIKEGTYTIIYLDPTQPIPAWILAAPGFVSITKTDEVRALKRLNNAILLSTSSR